jgi:hypothetical protein
VPGDAEKRKLGCGGAHARDKNFVLRWSALATILERIVETAGNVAQYRAAVPDGFHDFEMLPVGDECGERQCTD